MQITLTGLTKRVKVCTVICMKDPVAIALKQITEKQMRSVDRVLILALADEVNRLRRIEDHLIAHIEGAARQSLTITKAVRCCDWSGRPSAVER